MEEEVPVGADESAADYLKRIQSDAQATAPKPPGEESAASYLERISSPENALLDRSVSEGAKIQPQQAARVLRMQTRVPFPEKFIADNIDTLEADEKQGAYNTADLSNSNPRLSSLITKSPNYSAALLGDLPNLKKLEMLYSRPAELWPQPQNMIRERVTKDVDSTLEQDWKNNQESAAAEEQAGLPPATSYFGSKEEFRQWKITNGIADRTALENYVGGTEPIGAIEAIRHRASENPTFWAAYLGDAVDIASYKQLYEDAKAVNNDSATPEQEQHITDYARMEAAAAYRGTSFLGKTAEMMSALPAFATELGTSGGLYAGVEGAMFKGGKEAAEAFLKGAFKKVLEKGFATSMAKKLAASTLASGAQSLVARTLHGASEEAKAAIAPGLVSVDDAGNAHYAGTGDGKEFSIPAVFVRAFADVASAHSMEVLKPVDTAVLNWILKRNPNATLATVQNALRSGGVNGIFGGMGQMEVAKAINAIGGVAPYQAPTLEDLGVTALGFGLPHFLGAAGDVAMGLAPARKAMMQAEAFRARAETLAETLKDIPDLKPEVVQTMAAEGPHKDTWVPIKPFIEYFQAQKAEDGSPIDPKAKAAELGVPAEVFDNAKNTDQKIKVPTAVWDTIVGQTKDGRAFDKEITSAPNDMNGREAEAEIQRVADQMKANKEAEQRSAEAESRNIEDLPAGDPQAQEKAWKESARRVREAVAEQLKTVGLSESEVKFNPMLHEAVFSTLGKALGVDPFALAAKYPLKIQKQDQPLLTEPGQMEQPAYHGSPHKFDKFTTQKIGTGEGHQAFGWGLYFAGNKEVAQYYKDNVKNDAKITEINNRLTAISNEMDQHRAGEYGKFKTQRGYELKAEYDRLMDEKLSEKGRLYTVDIPEDGDYLDYNKPLSEQGDKVKAALAKIDHPVVNAWRTNGAWEHATGEMLYNVLSGGNTKGNKTGPEAASRLLNSLGIPGLKYADQQSRGTDKGTSNYVLFDDSHVNIKSYEQPGDLSPRGRYYVGQAGLDAGAVIDLFKEKNRSTFLHESGHRFLDLFRNVAESDLAPAALKADWATTLNFLGINSGDEIGKPQHEKWARAFEQYLREGKAPTKGLRDAFRRFKVWLLDVYKNARNLNVDLSPEIRGVFDRLLGAEAETKAAENESGHVSMFSDRALLKKLDLLPEKEDQVAKDIADIHAANEEDLTRKLLAQMEREKAKEWAAEKAALSEQIAPSVDALPEQQALRELKKEGGMRLDRDAIPKLFGDQYTGIDLATLPRGATVKEGGVHPDTMAEHFGFPSGKDLIRALQTAEPRQAMIDRLAEGQQRAIHGDDLATNPEALHDEALKTVHSDKAAQIMRKDIDLLMAVKPDTAKGIIRAIVHRSIPDTLLRAQADHMVFNMKIEDIDPKVAQKAEQQLHDEAIKLFLKGDIDGAIKAKQQQLANHEFYKAAQEARDGGAKIVKDARRVLAPAWEKGLRAEYGQQMKSILDRLGIARVDPKELAGRKPLAAWIAAKEQSGETNGTNILLPERFKSDELRQDWKTLTYAELQDVGRGLEQLRYYASEGDKMQAVQTEMRREEVLAAAVNEIEGSGPKREMEGFTSKTRGFMQKIYAGLRGIDAALLKPEQFFVLTGGGKIDSILSTFLWHPAADAGAAELDRLHKINLPILQAIEAMPKEIRSRMLERVVIPGVNRPLCRRDLLGIALNGGNESNYSKMIRGEMLRDHGLTEPQLREAIKQLTKVERDFVQTVWDSLEQMWPEVAALHKWATGIEPPKVEARPMLPGFETYRGGYYPLMYDRVETPKGEQQVEANIGGIQEQSYRRATLAHGYRESRVEGYKAAVDFDIDRLPGNVAGMLKDLTHRKWLVDANWLVNDDTFKRAIRERLGEEYNKMLQGWVKRVVNDRNMPSDQSIGGFRKFLSAARYNTTMVALGFRASTFLKHATGIGASVDAIGPAAFAEGTADFLSHPRDTYDMVMSKSGEMRHRFETSDIDLRDNLRKLEGGLTNSNLWRDIQKTALYTISWGNMIRDLPTWTGAYNKALRELGADGKTGDQLEKLAIYTADRAVRLSSGSGASKDVAAIMGKDGDFLRLLTMFYTPGSALYSRFRDIGHELAKTGNVPRFLMRTMYVWISAAVLHHLATGNIPDEDKGETWSGEIAKSVFQYPASAVPMGKEIFEDAKSAFTGEMPREASSPMFKGLVETGKLFHTGGQVVSGDKEWDDFAKQLFKTSGYYLGMPTGQLSTTGDYLYDISKGSADPNDLGEFMHDVLFTRPKSRR